MDSGRDGFLYHIKIALAGSFTLEPLADYAVVEAAADSIGLQTYIAPYGQCSQEVLNPGSGLYAFAPDVTLLAAEPDWLANDPISAADRLLSLAQNWKTNAAGGILLVCTFMAAPDWPLHVLSSERQTQLQQANQRLKEALVDDPQVHLFDLDGMAAYTGYAHAVSPEMMAMARVPFSELFLKQLAQKLCSHIKAVKGWSQKCLVLDCDNTLWGGIIGEDGLHGIALGPDWPGREFVEFQKAILELYEQGIILAVNSKNNEADVLEVFRRHPHMVLKEEHFAALKINWQAKPDNMQQLAQELNIGLDSMVFVDDNPAERQLMRQVFGQVKILDLPANPALYAKTLRETSFFTKAALSEEDRQRGQMYAAQRRRTELQKSAVSLEDFLKSLEMVCTIHKAGLMDVKRAAQLTQRTNQFNLTGRRYTDADIKAMLDSPDWNVYVLGLKDKFGDNGTVGLALVEKQVDSWRIDTFLMSCRVIGRQAEDALIDFICRDAVSSGAAFLKADYVKTAKNALVADFWDKLNFRKTDSNETSVTYLFDLTDYQTKSFEYLSFEQE
jgi:FkbH-like protein